MKARIKGFEKEMNRKYLELLLHTGFSGDGTLKKKKCVYTTTWEISAIWLA